MDTSPRRPWLARGRWPVFLAGVLSAGASLLIIWADVQTSGLTMMHVLAPVMVFIAMATGHYAAKHLLSFGGAICFVVSVVASILVMYEGVARRAEQRDTKLLTAQAQQTDRLDLRAERMDELKKVSPAQQRAAVACRGKREDSPNCLNKKAALKAIKDRVAELEQQLSETTVIPGDAKYANIAKQASVFGYDAAWIKEAIQTLDPLLLPIAFEAFSIVLVTVGLGGKERSTLARFGDLFRRQRKAHLPDDTAQTSYPFDPDAEQYFGPGGGAPIRRPVTPVGPAGGQKSELLANLLTKLALGQTIPSQKALREEYGIPRSTMCDWWGDWVREGLIPTPRKVGKCKMLTAA